ncbi:MAG: hypothetical protein R3F31_08065 [Verrucomicrobiales bacterium]
MEIKEYAHRVLFASSLEEKLSSSGAREIVDTDPGAALLGVPTPGRPEMLRMRPRGAGQSGAAFTGVSGGR